ncbi:unnamed protein product [Taenia asiatica]|uniref:Pentatricopeptide repeat-containing protein n=1 Tax=Taenia asiatica TaxID=60517 RepID=A0A0R3W7S3_TAEAS|nr:unnamed protein product [Taenia asiatica]
MVKYHLLTSFLITPPYSVSHSFLLNCGPTFLADKECDAARAVIDTAALNPHPSTISSLCSTVVASTNPEIADDLLDSSVSFAYIALSIYADEAQRFTASMSLTSSLPLCV